MQNYFPCLAVQVSDGNKSQKLPIYICSAQSDKAATTTAAKLLNGSRHNDDRVCSLEPSLRAHENAGPGMREDTCQIIIFIRIFV